MSEFLEIIGIKPFKFFRCILSLFITLAVAGYLFYQNSPSTKYIIYLAYKTGAIQKLDFKPCASAEPRACMKKIIEEQKLSDLTSAILVTVKMVGVYMAAEKNAVDTATKEKLILQRNQSLNDLLSSVNLKNHILVKMKPMFSFSKNELCTLQYVEKGLSENFHKKMSEQSSKDRQKTYEDYPNNKELIYTFVTRQEILDKLKNDIDTNFPADKLKKCGDQFDEFEKKEALKKQTK